MTIRIKIINESTAEENKHILVSNIKVFNDATLQYEKGQVCLGPGIESEFYVWEGREILISEISKDNILESYLENDKTSR